MQVFYSPPRTPTVKMMVTEAKIIFKDHHWKIVEYGSILWSPNLYLDFIFMPINYLECVPEENIFF